MTEAMYQEVLKLAEADDRTVSSLIRLTMARLIAEEHMKEGK